jgi:hypothetical protein
MPPRAGAFLNATGHAFAGRGVPKVKLTHGANILPAILAKLGIGGHGLGEEVSPGEGMPVEPPVPPQVNLPNPGGPNIPAPGAPVAPPAAPGAPPPPAATGPMENAAMPQIPGTQPPLPSAGNIMEHLIPLGGVHYYDPQTDSVVQLPQLSQHGGLDI